MLWWQQLERGDRKGSIGWDTCHREKKNRDSHCKHGVVVCFFLLVLPDQKYSWRRWRRRRKVLFAFSLHPWPPECLALAFFQKNEGRGKEGNIIETIPFLCLLAWLSNEIQEQDITQKINASIIVHQCTRPELNGCGWVKTVSRGMGVVWHGIGPLESKRRRRWSRKASHPLDWRRRSSKCNTNTLSFFLILGRDKIKKRKSERRKEGKGWGQVGL